MSKPQTSKKSLSIYRFTIKIYLSVLSHFFFVSSQVFKMIACSQNALSIADSKSFWMISFKHQGWITMSKPQTSKKSLSIYRFTIKVYLSVLSHFFFVSSQVFKMIACSQNALSIADWQPDYPSQEIFTKRTRQILEYFMGAL